MQAAVSDRRAWRDQHASPDHHVVDELRFIFGTLFDKGKRSATASHPVPKHDAAATGLRAAGEVTHRRVKAFQSPQCGGSDQTKEGRRC